LHEKPVIKPFLFLAGAAFFVLYGHFGGDMEQTHGIFYGVGKSNS